MCGIVGMIGKENVTESLIQGLTKLEYRGYDSAGICVNDQSQQPHVVKAVGGIADLAAKLTPEIDGTVGIGHTRWATHGEPTVANAHPHVSSDQRFALVHNGVIENFEELKEQFLSGAHLIGDTDTEIVVQLIAHFAENGFSTKDAFKAALAEIKGSYAFALMDKMDPNTIYVAKNKSPLLIGLGEGFNVICSDAMAMIKETNQFVEIVDGEIVTVTADKVVIETPEGQVINREPFEAQLDLNDIEKGTYPFYMLKEIDEQPAVMRKIVQAYTQGEKVTLDEALLEKINQCDRIYIIACGTSYNAGWVGKSLIETIASIPVEVHLSSEFGYNMPILSEKPFFIFLSQSGETADSRQVLVQVNELGHPSLTLTHVALKLLKVEIHATLLLSVAHELSVVAAVMETLIDEKQQMKALVEDYLTYTRNAFYIGRGVDYYVSMEAALKLKEISYIQAEGFAAGELKHGTIALIEEGTPVIGIVTDAKVAAHTRGNLKEVESRGARNIVIALESLAKPQDQLIIPDVHPLLSALVSIVPGQLLAYYATLQRGYDVDKPRNLAKSVTVE